MSCNFLFLPLLLAATGTQPDLELFNSAANEIAVTYGPDAQEAWLERRPGPWGKSGEVPQLVHSARDRHGNWSEPAPVAFASPEGDGEPFYDIADATLYFTSARLHPDLPDSGTNIWRVPRVNGHWGVPEALPAPVNGPGAEYSPVRRGDRLYFASYRDGDGDLYVATEHRSGWTVNKLGAAINTGTGEWNLWVSADEDLLIFEASNRPTNVTASGDLYASVTDAQGRWLPAVALRAVNGPGSELNGRLVEGTLIYASTSPHPARADLYGASVAVAERVAEAYRNTLFIVSRSSHELIGLDLLTGQPVSRTATGMGPHLAALTNGRLAVASYGVYPRPHQQPVEQMPGWVEEPGGELLVLDTRHVGSEPSRLTLPCQRPHGSVWNSPADRLWVTCEDRHGIVEIDWRGDKPAHRLITTGHAGAHTLAWDEARHQVVVVHTEAGGITFVDPSSDAAPVFLPIGPGSEGLWLDGDRGEGWVTVGPAGRLAVFNLQSRSVVEWVDLSCAFPIDFANGHDGTLWVACFGSSELVAIDPVKRREVDRLTLPAGPLNVAAHPTLPVLYASLPRQNRVVEISLSGGGISRSFAGGIEPDGLVVSSP